MGDAMSYIVIEDDAALDALDEAAGRKLAEAEGRPYPIPPDVVGPGRYPCGLTSWTPYAQLPEAKRARVWHRTSGAEVLRVEGQTGGLVKVDDAMRALDGEKVQTSKGEVTIAVVEVESRDVPAKYREAITVREESVATVERVR
jgi:hypothetical protein